MNRQDVLVLDDWGLYEINSRPQLDLMELLDDRLPYALQL